MLSSIYYILPLGFWEYFVSVPAIIHGVLGHFFLELHWSFGSFWSSSRKRVKNVLIYKIWLVQNDDLTIWSLIKVDQQCAREQVMKKKFKVLKITVEIPWIIWRNIYGFFYFLNWLKKKKLNWLLQLKKRSSLNRIFLFFKFFMLLISFSTLLDCYKLLKFYFQFSP